MKIQVYGNPAPQGSKRFLGTTRVGGKGIMVETSKKTAPWRADVIGAVRRYVDEWPDFAPYDGPLIGRMVFTFARPASVSRKKRPYMSVAPDLSKLIRSTEDALQAAGAIRDDCLIVEYTRQAKVYVGEDPEALDAPGALIVLGPLVPLAEITGGIPGVKEET